MKCLEAVPADKKPFKCSQCEFTFASMSDLHEHGKVHTYKKLIECSLCCQLSQKNSHGSIPSHALTSLLT